MEICAKPDYHKFLIGCGAVDKVQENTGARVIFPTNFFPSNKEADLEVITIIGTNASVNKAKLQLEYLVKDLVSE